MKPVSCGWWRKLVVPLAGGYFFSLALFIAFGAYYRRGVKLLFLAAIFFLVAGGAWRLRMVFPWRRYLPFVLFAAFSFVSTLLSSNLSQSLQTLFERYVYYFFVFEIGRIAMSGAEIEAFSVKAFKREAAESIGYVFLAAGLLMGCGGVYDYVRLHPQQLISVFGFEVEFFMFSLYLVYFIPVVFALCFSGRGQRRLAWPAFTLLLFCLVVSGNRTAWVSSIAGLVVVLAFMSRRIVVYAVPGICLFIALAFYFVPARLSDWGTLFFRQDIMNAALKMVGGHLFFGVGPGMYEKLIGSFATYALENRAFLHAHCMYLEVLTETGILGLCAFLSIFIVFFLRVRAALPAVAAATQRPLFIGLLAVVVSSLVFALASSIITVGFHDAPLFWLTFGLVYGLGQKIAPSVVP